MNRQAELDHLEKQKLLLEIATLKAENSILKEVKFSFFLEFKI